MIFASFEFILSLDLPEGPHGVGAAKGLCNVEPKVKRVTSMPNRAATILVAPVLFSSVKKVFKRTGHRTCLGRVWDLSGTDTTLGLSNTDIGQHFLDRGHI